MDPSTTLAIRRLRPDDAPALYDFYERLSPSSKRTFAPFGQHPALAQYENVVHDNDAAVDAKFDLVAVEENSGRIAGWGFVWDLSSDQPIFGLGVADEYHGQGVGRDLMDGVLDAMRQRGLRKLYLTVVTDNARAWQMYTRRGFVRYDEFTGEDGLPYYRMAAELMA